MKINTRMMGLLSILSMISLACQMMAEILPSGGSNPDSFTAAATSPISVQLTWSSVEGAQKYLIERSEAQSDYFLLGAIPGETTSFEDFPVPADTQVSYRVKTVTASGTSGGKTVSLTTPQEFANPLTVGATFETQNVQSQVIGPEGGSISITDLRGVSYTLDIPAGALDNEVTFSLSPIRDIQGLPLSGGMTSGVRIEPEGLVFNQSATLSIATSEPDGADGMMEMAFAFDGEGREFHFVRSNSAADTSAAFRLARPASKSWKMIQVPQNKSYGSGKGTSKDIRDQVKNHAPSSASDQMNQTMAAADDADLLAPLVDVQAVQASDAMLLFWGRQVELQVAGIDDWASFNDAVTVFQQWWEDRERTKNEIRKDEINKREDAIWEELTTNAKLKLEKAAEECKKSPNLADARKLVNQMLNGKRPFFKKFAEKFNQKYGAEALNKIKAKLDQCSQAYKATGQQEEMTYSGVICDLGQPFTVSATSAYYAITMQFAPSGSQAGSVTFSGTWFDVGPMDGGGSYTVKSADAVPSQLNLEASSCTHTPVKTVCASYKMNIDLVPLDTTGCGRP